MSFTSDIKKELTGVEISRKCCQLAQISGFMHFAGSITISSKGLGLKISTDNPAVARLFISLIKDYFGTKTALLISDGQVLSKGHQYEMHITPEMNADAILREVGILGVREGNNYVRDDIDNLITKKRCCKKSMLRGIFLACGCVSDPVKAYHLELSCDSENKASDVKKIINSFGLKSKTIQRRSKWIVYIKDAEQISDFLSIIGATNTLFHFENIRINKEMKNQANRIMNCTNANADKTVNASQKLIADIRYIEEKQGSLDYLPEKLKETAILRIENPELSLQELAELFDPPLGKSGLNHRFAKIKETADNLRKGSL